MSQDEFRDIVEQTVALVREHYVFPEVAEQVAGVLTEALATGRYSRTGADLVLLAGLVTDDMQGVNADLHLRLLHHVEPLPEAHGDDEADMIAIAQWADATGRGVAGVERLAGNVAHLDLRPLLFPPIVAGEAMAAAMTLVAVADVLILDLRGCLGGEPTMVAVVCSYLVGDEPVELSGFYERVLDRTRQLWTLPFVPGRRLGPDKPVYVLTSRSTFSGGEALAYDLQQIGRATVVGERTRGGAHPRRGFRVHPISRRRSRLLVR